LDNEYDNVKVNIGDRNVLHGAESMQKRKELLRNERKKRRRDIKASESIKWGPEYETKRNA
jgi:hypothetical protein